MNEELSKVFNKHWEGKRFVYRSKYGGEVIGTIESVFFTNSFTMDPDSSHNFAEHLQTKSPKGTRYKEQPNLVKVNPEKKYTAIRPEINIRSTNGQTYSLNEIFVITDKSFF